MSLPEAFPPPCPGGHRRVASRAARALVTVVAVAAFSAGPATAAAQSRPSAGRSPAVKIAKWTLLGTAIALGAYALRQSIEAADAYDALRDLCLDAPARCIHGGGAYADPEAEALYDRALGADRQAQLGIYTGEAALLGSVALFILDLRGGDGPPTIPFPGTTAAARRIVLLRVEF